MDEFDALNAQIYVENYLEERMKDVEDNVQIASTFLAGLVSLQVLGYDYPTDPRFSYVLRQLAQLGALFTEEELTSGKQIVADTIDVLRDIENQYKIGE